MKSSKQRKAQRKGANAKNSFSRALSGAGDQLTKRMTVPGLFLATGAGTTIPVASYSSSLVQSNPASEWASFAARYQQYRVRAIRVTGKSVLPVNTATVSHSILHMGDYIGSSVPANDQQVFTDENVKEVATHKDFVYVATWRRNPNAKLWNPTSAVIPVANTFSVVVASPSAPPLTTATTYYGVSVEWDVEFRGSQ
jgi:hypothetical protein